MLWMSLVVANHQNPNPLIGHKPINNRIREALHQRAPNAFHFCVELGVFDDAIYNRVDFSSEQAT